MPTMMRRRSPGAGSSRRFTETIGRVRHSIGMRATLAVSLALGWTVILGAQAPPRLPLTVAVTAEPSAQPDTLVYFNRPIVTLKATVLGRQPQERTEAA